MKSDKYKVDDIAKGEKTTVSLEHSTLIVES